LKIKENNYEGATQNFLSSTFTYGAFGSNGG
jgi:hypothetical protein